MFLVWAYHTGHLGKADLVALVDAVRAALERVTFEGWREVPRYLESWRSWAR